MKEKKKVLVFAPHPDDDILGCGGSMIKHLKNGNQVFVVYITNGDAECTEYPPEKFSKIRKKETLKAALVLGIKEENLYFLDEKIWKINETRVRFKFLELVRRIRPDVCYIPHLDESHYDHKIVHKMAMDAINMAPGKWFRAYNSSVEKPFRGVSIILAYEVSTPLMNPNYFEDISPFLEKKMAALKKHKTQKVRKYEHAHRGMNAFRGAMQKKIMFSEAFQLLKIDKIF